jgi:hypothetical protein
MSLFQKNPFPVCGDIERCWLLAYRTPADSARAMLPAPLHLITHGGFAFFNVVVGRLRAMRPAGLPRWCGVDYWHVAYRFYVRAALADGSSMDGIYFIHSDCDSRLLTVLGNPLTHFRFHMARVQVSENERFVRGSVSAPGVPAEFVLRRDTPPALSPGSPFATLTEAAAFLKYQPTGLAPAGTRAVNAITIRRDERAWISRLISVESARWKFLAGHETALECAWEVEPIAYRWNRARIFRTS